jgi:phosphohistidine swiveling domain-containing protein
MTSPIVLSTKARTLESLRPCIRTATILPLYYFTVDDYNKHTDNIVSIISSKFENRFVIVRSSSLSEDAETNSMAGYFDSVLNISAGDQESVRRGIEQVINSYGESVSDCDEILVQEQLIDLVCSGVAFTADLTTKSPYYVINFETGSSRSDIVTSGAKGNLSTYIHYKKSPITPTDTRIQHLIESLEELQSIFDNEFLDVEFAFDRFDTLYIFQVRQLVVKNQLIYDEDRLEKCFNKTVQKLKNLNVPHPNLLGKRAIYGVMPDWNPAEIIGRKPKTLSISLYRELVMDNIWAHQRYNYGYRDLRSHPLMVTFIGLPYVDVRVDFNSFIPASLNENIAAKLVDYYLDKLVQFPKLHDKVEFEIVHSCYYLNLSERLKELVDDGFSVQEIKRIEYSLLDLTNKVIDTNKGLFFDDLQKIEILKTRYEWITKSALPVIDRIYWLSEDCKRFGTLPFAGIARAAFIAVQLFKSFVATEIVSQVEYDEFMGSLCTVAKEMKRDLARVKFGESDKKEFLQKYGHLRPGAYDILSDRYDSNPDEYFNFDNANQSDLITPEPFRFTDEKLHLIDHVLIEHGLKVTAKQLIDFVRTAIESRESSKFIFTRSLSKIIMLIEQFGNDWGISKENIAHLDFRRIYEMYSRLDARSVKEIMEHDIAANKLTYHYANLLQMPILITQPEDIYCFYINADQPNYVTLKSVTGDVISESELHKLDCENKIVFIPSADPGYDFLFTKNIRGIVTKYGGVNSHMAIRCSELDIPAVIGAGETFFDQWGQCNIIEINCAEQSVRKIA